MEIMENYQKTASCDSGGITMQHGANTIVQPMKIDDELDFIKNCVQIEANKQNYNFGAEIVSTTNINDDDNEHRETNFEMKTNVADASVDAKTEEEEEQSNDLQTITKSQQKIEEALKDVQQPRQQQQVHNVKSVSKDIEDADEDDDDDDDSNRTEDDDEDEDDEGNDSYSSLGKIHRVAHHSHGSMQQVDTADESSSDSDFSDLSGLSDVSGREWKPICARPINWVQKQIHSGADPRELLSQMLPTSAHQIAPGLNDMTLWRILASMLSEPPRRQKLRYINTFNDVIQLVLQSKNIIVLTGAGVSVSCGIPDFRSSDGIYSRLAKDYPDLPDPQAMFDINYFSRDPRPFFKFAREIYPGQFKPSPCHRFIKLLEQKEKLLRNYTQNIDTLEQVAGIRNVIECHGSFSTASCTKCRLKCSADDIRADIFAQRIPVCHRCQPNVHQSVDASQPVSEIELKRLVENGIMKPDIVFFGEGLPEQFHTVMASDKDKCDLLIVIGSSLKVRPVALIPSSIPADVPQILINREQLHHLEFDVELLGDSDVIINQLCHHLGDEWKNICYHSAVLKESKELLPLEEETDTTEGEDDAQQCMLDTDTQSIKSNASTDIALRSAGAYSDSGFESSTSSGIVLAPRTPANVVGENSSCNSDVIKIENASRISELLPPDFGLDEPVAAVEFHPFVERLAQEAKNTTTTPQTPTSATQSTVRHMSIDSSKDSGIQCESSNSAVGLNLPPLANFDENNSAAPKYSANTSMETTTTESINVTATEADILAAEERELKRQILKRRSAAERLQEGTYYCHESSSSYVFPGAQVTWYTDSEDEDDADEFDETGGCVAGGDGGGGGGDNDNERIGACDNDTAPLSPLLSASVEAEMVSEITRAANEYNGSIVTTTASAEYSRMCTKRPASDVAIEFDNTTECSTTSTNNSITIATTKTTHLSNRVTTACNEPSMKRKRENNAENHLSSASSSTMDNATTAINSSSCRTTTTTTISSHY